MTKWWTDSVAIESAVVRVIEEHGTIKFATILAQLRLDPNVESHMRAVDKALQRLRRAGTIRLVDRKTGWALTHEAKSCHLD